MTFTRRDTLQDINKPCWDRLKRGRDARRHGSIRIAAVPVSKAKHPKAVNAAKPRQANPSKHQAQKSTFAPQVDEPEMTCVAGRSDGVAKYGL